MPRNTFLDISMIAIVTTLAFAPAMASAGTRYPQVCPPLCGANGYANTRYPFFSHRPFVFRGHVLRTRYHASSPSYVLRMQPHGFVGRPLHWFR